MYVDHTSSEKFIVCIQIVRRVHLYTSFHKHTVWSQHNTTDTVEQTKRNRNIVIICLCNTNLMSVLGMHEQIQHFRAQIPKLQNDTQVVLSNAFGPIAVCLSGAWNMSSSKGLILLLFDVTSSLCQSLLLSFYEHSHSYYLTTSSTNDHFTCVYCRVAGTR